MSSTTQRYPLSTTDGKAIPLDIIKASALILKTFSSVASGNIAIPANCEIISFIATADCIVRFGAAASIPADGVQLSNSIFIPQGMRITVAPTAESFSVIRYSLDGQLIAQCIDKWAGLASSSQLQRM